MLPAQASSSHGNNSPSIQPSKFARTEVPLSMAGLVTQNPALAFPGHSPSHFQFEQFQAMQHQQNMMQQAGLLQQAIERPVSMPGSGTGTPPNPPPAGQRTFDGMYDMMYSVSQSVINMQNTIAPRIDSMCEFMTQLKSQVDENRVQGLSRMDALERSVQALQRAPPSSRPAPTQHEGEDNFEAIIRGWPTHLDKQVAIDHVKKMLVATEIPGTIREIRGKYVDFVLVSFESLTDKQTWIHDAKQLESGLVFNVKGATINLRIQNIVPPHIKIHSDIAKHLAWHLKDDTLHEHAEEIMYEAQYREVTLFSQPIAYYVDSNLKQICAKRGGEFCIDGNLIQSIASEHEIAIDIPGIQRYLQQKFRDRQILLK